MYRLASAEGGDTTESKENDNRDSPPATGANAPDPSGGPVGELPQRGYARPRAGGQQQVNPPRPGVHAGPPRTAARIRRPPLWLFLHAGGQFISHPANHRRRTVRAAGG